MSEKDEIIAKYRNDDFYEWQYKTISAYKLVEDPENWEPCPDCKLIPKVWVFDNGRSTGCGCGESRYRSHSIHAESIASHMKYSHNRASIADYDGDELRKNWNHWCKTKEVLFDRSPKSTRW